MSRVGRERQSVSADRQQIARVFLILYVLAHAAVRDRSALVWEERNLRQQSLLPPKSMSRLGKSLPLGNLIRLK
jgi:hypothetical protein